MHQNHEKQLPISIDRSEYDLSKELRVISDILDIYPTIYDKVLQDISEGKRTDRGGRGLSGEQVIRCAILMRIHGLSYKKLSFPLADSESFKEFSCLGFGKSISR